MQQPQARRAITAYEHWIWVRVAGPPKERLILFRLRGESKLRSGRAPARGLSRIRAERWLCGARRGGVRLKLTHAGYMAHARRRFFEAKVSWLDRHQHPHLRRNGNHVRHRNAFTSPTTSVGSFKRIVNRVPSGAATSTTAPTPPGRWPDGWKSAQLNKLPVCHRRQAGPPTGLVSRSFPYCCVVVASRTPAPGPSRPDPPRSSAPPLVLPHVILLPVAS